MRESNDPAAQDRPAQQPEHPRHDAPADPPPHTAGQWPRYAVAPPASAPAPPAAPPSDDWAEVHPPRPGGAPPPSWGERHPSAAASSPEQAAAEAPPDVARESAPAERPRPPAPAASDASDAGQPQREEEKDGLEAVVRAVQSPPESEPHRLKTQQPAPSPASSPAPVARPAQQTGPVMDTALPPAGERVHPQRPRIRLARRQDDPAPAAERPFPGPVTFGKVHPRAGEVRGVPQVEQAVPDIVLDLADFDGLAVRAASLRGDDHRFTGKPRQDSLGLWTVPRRDRPDLLVAAVADGVGSRSLSHLGASWACRLFREQIAAHAEEVFVQDDIEELGRRIVERVAAAMTRWAEQERLHPAELSTTLVAAAVELPGEVAAAQTPHRCFVVRVGDSTAYLLRRGEFAQVFDGAHDEGGSSTPRPPRCPPAWAGCRSPWGPSGPRRPWCCAPTGSPGPCGTPR